MDQHSIPINMILNDQKNKCIHENEFVESRRSQRMRIEKNLGSNFISSQAITFLVQGTRDFVINKIPIMLIVESDPQMYKKGFHFLERSHQWWKGFNTVQQYLDLSRFTLRVKAY